MGNSVHLGNMRCRIQTWDPLLGALCLQTKFRMAIWYIQLVIFQFYLKSALFAENHNVYMIWDSEFEFDV